MSGCSWRTSTGRARRPLAAWDKASIIYTATGDLHAMLILPRTKIEKPVCYLSGDIEARRLAEPTEV